jgi:NAD(P)H-hydrate epimerase
MREIDRLTTERYGIPSLVLMENAAGAAARIVTESLSGDVAGKGVLVLCGPGNNGGDGAAMARLLTLVGGYVQVVLFGRVENTRGDARVNFEMIRNLAGKGKLTDAENSDVPAVHLFPNSGGFVEFYECGSEDEWHEFLYHQLDQSPDVVIDALFGTGLRRPIVGVHREVVRHLHSVRAMRQAAEPRIVSLDIPSGLNSDLAELIGPAVIADVTVTMTAPKPANVLPPAANRNGELVIADIGSTLELIETAETKLFVTEAADAYCWLVQTRYTPESYKNTHGHALIIAGSKGFTGAAVLCGNAAMRAGAGLVTVATPASAQSLVAAQVMPEVMTAALAETDLGTISDAGIDYVLRLAQRANVVAIGPGISAADERTRQFVRSLVEHRTTALVIDADGLNCLAPWPDGLWGSPEYPIVLTPHPGEMLRLMGVADKSALSDRVEAARVFATTHQVIVVLKGTRSLIAAPDGRVFVNPTGNAGLGTAGAGDTLTGIITGFLAQAYGTLQKEADALDAVIAAIYVGGLAGDMAARERGMRTMVASDIREHLSAAICALDPEGEKPLQYR